MKKVFFIHVAIEIASLGFLLCTHTHFVRKREREFFFPLHKNLFSTVWMKWMGKRESRKGRLEMSFLMHACLVDNLRQFHPFNLVITTSRHWHVSRDIIIHFFTSTTSLLNIKVTKSPIKFKLMKFVHDLLSSETLFCGGYKRQPLKNFFLNARRLNFNCLAITWLHFDTWITTQMN